MLRFFGFIIVTLVCLGADFTYAQNSSSKKFTIQLGSYRTPDMSKFSSLSVVGKVEALTLDNGIKRVILGSYDFKKDANNALAQAKSLGFKDAFVANRPKSAGVANVASKPKKPKFSKPETHQVQVPKTSRRPNPNNLYTIQLGAYKDVNFNRFYNLIDLGDVYSSLDGDFKRISLGNYYSEASANKVLTKVQKRGYPSAFARKETSKKK